MQVECNQAEDGTMRIRLAGVVTDGRQTSLDDGGIGDSDYARPILVSFRDVTLLNSTGIGLLLQLNRRVRERGGQLVLHSLPPYIQQVISFMKLDKLLQIAKSEQEAHELLT